jgi:RNA polymerase sigma-70 factor (ECF subfamily)
MMEQGNGHREHRSVGPTRSDRDAELLASLRRRDATAVEALVAAYSDRLYRLAIHITGNAMDAQEVVRDALWNATRKIDTFRGESAFGSWLYRITTNAAYQTLRQRRHARREVSWDDRAPSFDEHGQHVEPPADWSAHVEELALQTELRALLTAAIEDLPVDYRLAFLLHDLEGLSNPETSEVLSVSLPAVKSRVHRSRLFLRKRLAEYFEGAGLSAGTDPIGPARPRRRLGGGPSERTDSVTLS